MNGSVVITEPAAGTMSPLKGIMISDVKSAVLWCGVRLKDKTENLNLKEVVIKLLLLIDFHSEAQRIHQYFCHK